MGIDDQERDKLIKLMRGFSRACSSTNRHGCDRDPLRNNGSKCHIRAFTSFDPKLCPSFLLSTFDGAFNTIFVLERIVGGLVFVYQ